jgi:uncharacterized ferritin-like protein (DUF455 family)
MSRPARTPSWPSLRACPAGPSGRRWCRTPGSSAARSPRAPDTRRCCTPWRIEFNAINLALDAVWRFSGLPDQYYRDWAQVAREEAYHFGLMRDHLATLGSAYGDFPAHDALWRMTERTAGDVLARMALVPRTLEARGLDASPPMQTKLQGIGDARGVEILGIILRDEIGHVAVGNRWYRWLCERAGVDPVAHYAVLTERYDAPRLQPPFNEDARRLAGFTETELSAMRRGD